MLVTFNFDKMSDRYSEVFAYFCLFILLVLRKYSLDFDHMALQGKVFKVTSDNTFYAFLKMARFFSAELSINEQLTLEQILYFNLFSCHCMKKLISHEILY